jgi:hypothetical protein
MRCVSFTAAVSQPTTLQSTAPENDTPKQETAAQEPAMAAFYQAMATAKQLVVDMGDGKTMNDHFKGFMLRLVHAAWLGFASLCLGIFVLGISGLLRLYAYPVNQRRLSKVFMLPGVAAVGFIGAL